jgi:methylated-DNA-[protein]-cysteine S-methyltransferase
MANDKRYTVIHTPLGELWIAGNEQGLTNVSFPSQRGLSAAHQWSADWVYEPQAFAEARRQLTGYLAGDLQVFDLPLAAEGTAFRKQVWAALCNVPWGATASYGQIAKAIGRPSASRAVGAANGANPLPIIVPCHRIIGSSGQLTGYAGGLHIKQYLLELEGVLPQQNLSL